VHFTLPYRRFRRRAIVLSALACALAFGIGGSALAGVFMHDSSAPLAPDMPGAGPGPDFNKLIPPLPEDARAAKESLRAAAPEVTALPESTEPAPEWLQPFADSGPPDDVETVKREVVEDLILDGRGGALAAGAPVPTLDAVTTRLTASGKAWASRVRDAVVAENASADVEAWSDPTYKRYQDVRVTVTQWTGVRVTPERDTARAVFVAHFEYLDGRMWTTTDEAQQQVELVNEQGRWRLLSLEAVQISGG
jgi:hypothetical protein